MADEQMLTERRRFTDLGVLLLEAGLPVTDVRASLDLVAGTTIRADRPEIAVLPETVFIGMQGSTGFSTANAGTLSVRQSAAAGRLVRALRKGRVGLDAVDAQIAAIRATPIRFPLFRRAAGSALIALGLAVLFRCPWWAIALATLVGFVVGAISQVMERNKAAVAIVPFVSALISTLLVGLIAEWLHLGPVPLFAVSAPIAILVPGALLTNSLLELTATDIVSGSSRLLYGLIVLGMMIAGIVAGAAWAGVELDLDSAAQIGEIVGVGTDATGWAALPPLWLSWIGVVMLAIGIGVAFASGFRLTAVSVIVMVATYALLIGLAPFVGSVIAAGITAAVLFIAARTIERVFVILPATVSFQPAFLLLVPGTVGLVALTSLDPASLTTTPLTFLSLCIGIKVGSLITDSNWRRSTHAQPGQH